MRSDPGGFVWGFDLTGFIELLLTKIDLVDLIHSQIPLKKKSGSNYFARCPFHNEKSASFSVSQPKQFYYCFGCGAHGNAIDFMMQHDRLSFREAIETLARQAGMEVPRSASHVKKDDSLPLLYELMTKVAAYYYEKMRHTERAIQYLKTRGVSGSIAKAFQLGYAEDGWNHLLDHLGKTETDKKRLLETGLIIKKSEGGYYDRFRGRILFPIHDYRGRIIGFGGRIIAEGEPKYLNSPETPLFQKGHELYGLYQALQQHRKLEKVLIVEGYMDVIALFQHGITYAVATLGTATTHHHLQRLFRYTSEIVFCFDGDAAGRTAAWRALLVLFPLMQDHLQIRFLFLPEGEDPDTLIRKEGKSAFEKRIAGAQSLSAFFFQTLSQQSDMGTIEGRAQFANLALSHMKDLPPSLFQDILIDELSKRARIELNSLKKQLKGSPGVNNGVLPFASPQPKMKLPHPVRLVITLLLQQPELASLMTEPLPKSQLPGYLFLEQLLEIIQKSPHIKTGMLLEYWRGQKEESFIAKLAHFEHSIPENGVKNEFLGALRQLNQLAFDEEINRLLAKGAQEGLTSTEKVALSEWIAKKKKLEHPRP